MPGTYKMLKGDAPYWMPEPKDYQKEGAFYSVAGPSVSRYKKASVLITLPTDYALKTSSSPHWWSRNAYVSLGVDSSNMGGIDIGLRNAGRYGAGEPNPGDESDTDQGYGWEVMCYECKLPDKLHKVPDNSANKAPAGTVRAKVDIRPNPNGRQITLYVEWLNKKNDVLSNFLHTYDLSRTYNWTGFYRFASLVTTNPQATMNDKTYMRGGVFETAYVGENSNINWGINSTPTLKSWIVTPSKCSIPYKWDVGEWNCQYQFSHKRKENIIWCKLP